MRVALFVALATLTGATPRFHRVNERTPQGRSTRGLMSDSLAFFEAFPASGAGTTTACSTTAPTGARGETLTFTRASNGTCTKTATGGLATTGIANGDLVVLSSNVARTEYDSNGVLGLLVEAQGINLLPRYNNLTDAAWSDVGTPGVADGATDPFGGTTGDTITDNDGAAYEGRSQPITVSAGAAHIAYCYVKAGTLSAARITLDGTATNITGLSAATWSIVQVADASSSGVSIVVQVLAGSATSDTGTVIWGGCDAKTGTYITSIVPTVAAAATRAAEVPYFTIPATEIQSFASSVFLPGGLQNNARVIGDAFRDANNVLVGYAAGPGASPLTAFQLVGGSSKAVIAATNVTLNAANRLVSWVIPSTTVGAIVNGTETTSSAGVLGAVTGVTRIYVGTYSSSTGFESNGIQSRICADPLSTRCR